MPGRGSPWENGEIVAVSRVNDGDIVGDSMLCERPPEHCFGVIRGGLETTTGLGVEPEEFAEHGSESGLLLGEIPSQIRGIEIRRSGRRRGETNSEYRDPGTQMSLDCLVVAVPGVGKHDHAGHIESPNTETLVR